MAMYMCIMLDYVCACLGCYIEQHLIRSEARKLVISKHVEM